MVINCSLSISITYLLYVHLMRLAACAYRVARVISYRFIYVQRERETYVVS